MDRVGEDKKAKHSQWCADECSTTGFPGKKRWAYVHNFADIKNRLHIFYKYR